jgi:hypothetical protein
MNPAFAGREGITRYDQGYGPLPGCSEGCPGLEVSEDEPRS